MSLRKYSEFKVISENRKKGKLTESGETFHSISNEPFEIIEMADDLLDCVLRAKSDNRLYFFSGEDNVDKSDLEEYGDVPGDYEPDDSGGSIWIPDFENWEVEDWVLESYVNDNFSNLRYGEGLEDYQAGNSEIILIDEELKEFLIENFGFSKI